MDPSRHKRYRDDKVSRGICRRCTQPAATGRTLCGRHLLLSIECTRKYRRRVAEFRRGHASIGKRAAAIDWAAVNWEYGNHSISKLLDVCVTYVCKQRRKHAPHTRKGPGGAKDDGDARSGEHAPYSHLKLAAVCRRLLNELASGEPTPETCAQARELLWWMGKEKEKAA